ncbi:CDP-diacylglycerol--serine O-phosphatidyltransferase [Microbaculum marinisediminis]|uniref:CDP-diacylglycerol--serine O-phosphatidyltransferase n=1 Tax=Microbaculum marinisediminis TaxID=2931392 RepID=A0AAW5QWG2_9HYPH|nr:CDP-diacylglycerol--serine O-phosphatidyltransferase [Microbaculum sp. A6E488]MCT8971003.1 CDP-diacylglycerol--serine O-phosphatidyltransferase [Microbaculum sp. A6E488]
MSMPFPPFDPDEPGSRRRRALSRVPVRQLLPNMITLLALCSGLTSIRMSFEDKFDIAIAAIVLAAILDALDGRVARILKSTSRFGAELDSLADFVNFGVAPSILLYAWSLDGLGNIGWISGLVFAVCVALRLARFNVALDDRDRPSWAGRFFTGVPAPAGALTVLLPVYLQLAGIPEFRAGAPAVLVYELAIGFLMVSRLPTYSGKQLGERVPRELVLPVFVAFILVVALLIAFPWQVLAIGTIAYLASLPMAFNVHRKLASSTPGGAGETAPATKSTEDG